MPEDRTWLKAFQEMHEEVAQAMDAKRELDEIKLLLKELDVGQVPGYQPLSAIQGIRKLHRAWLDFADGPKKLTYFMQQNEALLAENAKLRDVLSRQSSRISELEAETAEAWAAVKQLDGENIAQDAKSDAVIGGLRRDTASLNAEMVQLRKAYAWLQEEYTNRGQIIQDFAKREHAHQEKIAELERLLGEINHLGGLTATNALQWKANYERQHDVNMRQRSRIAKLRLGLQRIAGSESDSSWTLRSEASSALYFDDLDAVKPITKEAK